MKNRPDKFENFFRGRAFEFVIGIRHAVTRGHDCPMHSHPSLEIVAHPAGHGVTRLENGSTLEFAEGSVVIYAPHIRHDQVMAKSGRDYCIHLDCPLSDMLGGCLYVPPLRDAQLTADIDAISRYSSGLPRMQQLALSHRATALLIQLVEAAGEGARGPRPAAERYADAARQYIYSRADTIERMEDVARTVGVSHDYLRHLFRERYGMSLARCLGLARVERSKDLLVRSALPLKTIAKMCGFGNERYFSAVFRKFERCAPGEYRRRTAQIL